MLTYMGKEVCRRHDMFLYLDSNVDGFLPHKLIINGQQYMFYGDSSYYRRAYLDILFEGANLIIWKAARNTAMSKSIIKVKWFFKKVKMIWAFIDRKSR